MAANFLGYGFSVAISYLGNARLTFVRPAADPHQFLRFVVVSLTGLGLNQLLTYGLVALANQPFWLALAVVVLVVPGATFLLSRSWAFRPGDRGP